MICASKASYEDVKKFVYNDWFYDRITDDYCPAKEDFIMPKDGYIAIKGSVNGELASLFVVHDSQLHYMVFKRHRKLADRLFEACMLIHKKDTYCEIPSLYMEVVNFAKKVGFIEVGIKEGCHLKNGKLYDVHVLEYLWD